MTVEIRVATVGQDDSSIRLLGWKGDGISRHRSDPSRRWIEANGSSFDLMHVERWPETSGLDEAEDFLGALDAIGTPLVYSYPGANGRSTRLKEAFVHSADRVVVNTREARTDLMLQYGRRGVQIPNSQVLDLEELNELPPRRRIPPFTLGLILDDLSPDPTSEVIVEVMTQMARESSCFRVRVDVEAAGYEPEKDPGSLSTLLLSLARRNQLQLLVHESIDRTVLRDFATEVDIALVPSWKGPYSGWLEACRDTGTALVVPTGEDADSLQPAFRFRVFPTGAPHRGDLTAACEAAQKALVSGEIVPVGADRRRHHRRVIADRYAALFQEVLAAGVAETRPSGNDQIEELAA